MNEFKIPGKAAAATTKQLVLIWLLGAVIEWPLQYLNRWLSPSTAGDNLPFEAIIGNACAVFFFLRKWPETLALSRFRPHLCDLAIGIPMGYLMTNITAAIVGRAAFETDWMLTNPQRKLTFICATLIVPVLEELIYRATILGSLAIYGDGSDDHAQFVAGSFSRSNFALRNISRLPSLNSIFDYCPCDGKCNGLCARPFDRFPLDEVKKAGPFLECGGTRG
jgi:membrane protease YdiL (CAAX protease family)